MKRSSTLGVTFLLFAGLTACGGDTSDTAPATSQPAGAPAPAAAGLRTGVCQI